MNCLVIPPYLLTFPVGALFAFRIEPWTLSSNASFDISTLAVDKSIPPCSLLDQSQFHTTLAKRSLRPITSLPSDLKVGNSATAIGLL